MLTELARPYHQDRMVSLLAKIIASAVLMLTLTSFTTGAPNPDNTLENIWDIFNCTDREIAVSPVVPRSTIGHIARREAQLGSHSINLEPGVDFQDCVAAPHCKGMSVPPLPHFFTTTTTLTSNRCTFSFIEHSSWQSHAVLHIYDTYCNQIGENTAVPRDFLADPRGWGFSSNLPL